MKQIIAPLLLAGLLSACATPFPPTLPEGYDGPIVELADTGKFESFSRGAFFVATAIDGRGIQNSLIETRQASYGKGALLERVYTRRDVPVVPMKVKLVGTHQTGAPIHEIAARVAGTFFSVEGEVLFTPQVHQVYVVTGELKKGSSCVWIAETQARDKPVTDKVCEKPLAP